MLTLQNLFLACLPVYCAEPIVSLKNMAKHVPPPVPYSFPAVT